MNLDLDIISGETQGLAESRKRGYIMDDQLGQHVSFGNATKWLAAHSHRFLDSRVQLGLRPIFLLLARLPNHYLLFC